MKILLTGGSGDLGSVLVPLLGEQGHLALIFDPQDPQSEGAQYIQGSILDSYALQTALEDIDLVIHIAAWHGIHEARGWKTAQDFWDLNVNGTHNLLQACVSNKVTKLIHISSSSVSKLSGYYGFTKRLAEQAVDHFQQEHALDVVTLRPRAFIPPWNTRVYQSYLEWARRFWPGAVHINDVAQAVLKSIGLLQRQSCRSPEVFTIDREPDYPQSELEHWDAQGPGSSFHKTFSEFEGLLSQFDLDPSIKPLSHDISEAKRILRFAPLFGLKELLQELASL